MPDDGPGRAPTLNLRRSSLAIALMLFAGSLGYAADADAATRR